MGIEENILSKEDLASVDPFAEPSQESVLAFPEIQHKADGTHVHQHADEGTRLAVDHLQQQVMDPVAPETPEPASYSQPLDVDSNDDLWFKRLERMADRKNPPIPPVELAGDSHDYVAEEETAIVEGVEFDGANHLDDVFADTSVLEELENIQYQLKEIGGVSRTEIIAIESLLESPGIFGNPRAYSATYTKSNYASTMESLGIKIKNMVADLIKWIMEQCKNIAGMISKALGTDAMKQHMTTSLITKRQELLVKARRIDAVYGLKSFKGMTSASNIPPYKEATSTENFCIRYLDYRTRVSFQNRFTIGMRMIIENSGLSGHVKNLRGELDRSLKQVEDFVSILQKTELSNWGKVNDQFNISGLNTLAAYWNVRVNSGTPNDIIGEYRTAVHFAFRQTDTRAKRPGEFVKVANYTNPFSDNPTFGKTMSVGMDRIARALKDLENKVARLDNNGNYTVHTGKLNEVNRRLTIVQNLFTLYLAFAKYYEAFYITLLKPIIVLNRQLDLFSARSAVTGVFSSESHNVEGMTLEEFNAYPGDGLREVLGAFQNNIWVDRSEVNNDNALEFLLSKGLIYKPKVIDLENPTPDFGITPAGRQLCNQVFNDLSEDKVMDGVRAVCNPEHLGARELLRHHGRLGFNRFDDSQIQQITDDAEAIHVLESNGLVKANKPYHPIHDADEGTWVMTDLGMEVAKFI